MVTRTMSRILFCLAMFVAIGFTTSAQAANNTKLSVIGQQHIAASVAVVACRPGCIDYKYHRLGSRCKFERCNMYPTLLLVEDPCTGCAVEVPVCVPNCCTAPCSVDSRNALFGRTIHEYCWDCGFRMKVVVRKSGDLVVHYYGVR